jgi:hypothetical protein
MISNRLCNKEMRAAGLEPARVSPQNPKSKTAEGPRPPSESNRPAVTAGNGPKPPSFVTLAVTRGWKNRPAFHARRFARRQL